MTLRMLIAASALLLGACSHDFHLVDGDAGADGPRADAAVGDAMADAAPDAPPGAFLPVVGGLGTERLHTGANGLAVFGGFAMGATACPATGLCVQGGLHP